MRQVSELVTVCCLDQFQELKVQITLAGKRDCSSVGGGEEETVVLGWILVPQHHHADTPITQTSHQTDPVDGMGWGGVRFGSRRRLS